MMNKGHDIAAEFPGLVILHQKIPGHEVGRHEHKEHEFFLPLQGEITVDYGDDTAKAGPGHMLYVPPNLDHSFSSSAKGSGERVIWLIEQKIWKQHLQTQFLPLAFPINSLAKELVFYLLIHREAAGAKYFISALIETLGESLQSTLLEKSKISSEHISGRVVDERIRRSIEVIESNLSLVSLAEVPRASGLSARNFNRLFLKETGLTPKDFLILRRIEKAKVLLKTTKMTVTDISLEVGYNSLSKFIATFKKIAGILPSDFRTNPANY